MAVHCVIARVFLFTLLLQPPAFSSSLTSESIFGDPRYMQFILCAIRICMCQTKKLSSSLFKLTTVIASLRHFTRFSCILSILSFFCFYLKSFATLFCLPLTHTDVSSHTFLSKHIVLFSHPFFCLCLCSSLPCALCFCSLCPLPPQMLFVL